MREAGEGEEEGEGSGRARATAERRDRSWARTRALMNSVEELGSQGEGSKMVGRGGVVLVVEVETR